VISWGSVPSGAVLPFPFDSYDGGTGASITLTGLAVTDVEIYKGTSMTQRASDAGVVLLDTDGIDIDGTTGIHGFSIDTGDNTDAGFYAVGSFFYVVVSAVTIDAQTVNFVAGTFRLGAAEAIAGKPKVDVDAWLGTAAATPTVAGVPEVDLTHVAGATTDVSALATNVAAILVDTGTTLDGKLDTIDNFLDTEVAAILSAVDTEVAAILSDTNAILIDTAEIGAAGAGLTAINLPNQSMDITGNITGNLSGSVGSVTGLTAATVHSDLDDIQARLPAALTAGGNMKSDVLAVDGVVDAADRLQKVAQGNVFCTVGAASTTTSIVTSAMDPAAAVADQFKGRIATFKNDTTTTNLRGQSTDITASTDVGVLSCTALSDAPVSGDVFTIS